MTTQIDGRQILDNSIPDQKLSTNANNFLGNVITQNTTLNVPIQYATINDALNYLSTKTIMRGAIVTIKVADGTYTLTSGITFAHSQGERIKIIGNILNPGNVLIQSPADGFYVPQGFKLAEIDGFKFLKTGAASVNIGVYTDGGSIMKCGPHLIVDGFYHGIAARNGGNINAAGTASDYVQVFNGGDTCIWAYERSFVNAQYARVSGAKDTANNLGSGFLAEFSSVIDATGSKSFNNYLNGYSAFSSSAIRAWGTECYGNGVGNASGKTSGYYAAENGSIEVSQSNCHDNTGYGDLSDSDGKVYGRVGAVYTNNSLGAYKEIFELQSSGKVNLNSGSLTIDGTTAYNANGFDTYFDINGKTGQFAIRRYLVAGVEKCREQWREDVQRLVWNGPAGNSVTWNPTDGDIALGLSAPAVGATKGFLQIPKMAGKPTGTPASVQTGYSPIVHDTTNNRLWLWNGSAWLGTATLTS
ncbi:hypothetical protein [Ralstonia phage RSP15]|uniref:hypothetical protein n=1 Tax=Ralstonia phage RSP15 TaxID=1785960 RepID=UPI00074D3CDE|nr:hypothetical protein BH754_gp080 [Ralstonia phage RSP15]BAU40038.1 hypothetical protein [Ralstonia phage RSP15]